MTEILSKRIYVNKEECDGLYGNPTVHIDYMLKAINGEKYVMKGNMGNKLLTYSIKVYKEDDVELEYTQMFGRLVPGHAIEKETNLECWTVKFDCIESRNPEYQGYGFGSLMMELFLELLARYEEEIGCVFKKIEGTIGDGGGNDRKKSVPFYKKFDHHVFGNRHLELETDEKGNLGNQLKYHIV